jgi:hypothetical protein
MKYFSQENPSIATGKRKDDLVHLWEIFGRHGFLELETTQHKLKASGTSNAATCRLKWCIRIVAQSKISNFLNSVSKLSIRIVNRK